MYDIVSKLSDRLDDVTRELEEAKRKLSIGKTVVPALTYAFVTFTVKKLSRSFFFCWRAGMLLGFKARLDLLLACFLTSMR